MQPQSPSALEPRLKSGWKRACARSHSCMSEHYFSRGRGARDGETSSIARGAKGFNCTRENAAVRGHGTEDSVRDRMAVALTCVACAPF